MTLDRGVLAKIDRRILSELDHAGGVQLAKIPLSDAVWSTWRRYCDAGQVTMGQGIAGLVVHELGTVVGRDGDEGSVFGVEFERRLAAHAEDLDTRERSLNERDRLLRASEQRFRTEEQRLLETKRFPLTSAPKVGRNDRCPCGSGLKYKHCHGLPGRRT
jgi:uncharacterized protein YchJ